MGRQARDKYSPERLVDDTIELAVRSERRPFQSHQLPHPSPPPAPPPVGHPDEALDRTKPMPMLAFSTCCRGGGEPLVQSILEYFRLGGRHIDIDQWNQNLEDVGEAIRSSGVPREELWVTAKVMALPQLALPPSGAEAAHFGSVRMKLSLGGGKHKMVWVPLDQHLTNDGGHRHFDLRGYPQDVRLGTTYAANRTLKELGLRYVDMLMLHSPKGLNDYMLSRAWDGLNDAYDRGYARHVGVTDFKPYDIEVIARSSGVWPAYNQIQFSPWDPTARQTYEFCMSRGVRVGAWGITERAMKTPGANTYSLHHMSITHGFKSEVQLLIKYALAKRLTVTFGSRDKEHIREDMYIHELHLADWELEYLESNTSIYGSPSIPTFGDSGGVGVASAEPDPVTFTFPDELLVKADRAEAKAKLATLEATKAAARAKNVTSYGNADAIRVARQEAMEAVRAAEDAMHDARVARADADAVERFNKMLDTRCIDPSTSKPLSICRVPRSELRRRWVRDAVSNLSGKELSDEQLDRLIRDSDSDGDGDLSYSEIKEALVAQKLVVEVRENILVGRGQMRPGVLEGVPLEQKASMLPANTDQEGWPPMASRGELGREGSPAGAGAPLIEASVYLPDQSGAIAQYYKRYLSGAAVAPGAPPPPVGHPDEALDRTKPMPMLAFGTCCRGGGEPLKRSIMDFIHLGGRHIDTAFSYRNIEDVSEAIRSSGVPREELWVTMRTLEWPLALRAPGSRFVDRNFDHLDLLLLHPPPEGLSQTDMLVTWRHLLGAVYPSGYARHIGVSNFGGDDIDAIARATGVWPAYNQIQFSPWEAAPGTAARQTYEFCMSRGVRVGAWGITTRAVEAKNANSHALASLALAHGVSEVQLLIRWGLSKRVTVTFGSRDKEHIREDMYIHELHLADWELNQLEREARFGNGRGWIESVDDNSEHPTFYPVEETKARIKAGTGVLVEDKILLLDQAAVLSLPYGNDPEEDALPLPVGHPEEPLDRTKPMPMLAFGTCCRGGGEPLIQSVLSFIRLGGRHIDTAQWYQNHQDIGEAIRRSGVPREELWVTTKVMALPQLMSSGHGGHNVDFDLSHYPKNDVSLAARYAAHEALEELGLEYLDMLLFHTPEGLPDFMLKMVWKGLVDFARMGRTRHVGVSNFKQYDIEVIARSSGVWPAYNQIQFSPWDPTARQTYEFCMSRGVRVGAWGITTRAAKAENANKKALVRLANAHGVSEIQLLLKWALSYRVTVTFGASSEEHIREDMYIHELHLTESELNQLEEGRAAGAGANDRDKAATPPSAAQVKTGEAATPPSAAQVKTQGEKVGVGIVCLLVLVWSAMRARSLAESLSLARGA